MDSFEIYNEVNMVIQYILNVNRRILLYIDFIDNKYILEISQYRMNVKNEIQRFSALISFSFDSLDEIGEFLMRLLNSLEMIDSLELSKIAKSNITLDKSSKIITSLFLDYGTFKISIPYQLLKEFKSFLNPVFNSEVQITKNVRDILKNVLK